MTTTVLNRQEFSELLSKDLKKGIFVNGNTGVGKTLLLGKMLGSTPRSINRISDAIDEKGNYNQDSLWNQERRLVNSSPVYVIDDLGNEDDKHSKVVSRIIEDRHTKFHETHGAWKTHITTNLTLQELVKRYGAGTVRRISEMCYAFDLRDTCMTE